MLTYIVLIRATFALRFPVARFPLLIEDAANCKVLIRFLPVEKFQPVEVERELIPRPIEVLSVDKPVLRAACKLEKLEPLVVLRFEFSFVIVLERVLMDVWRALLVAEFKS